MACFRFWRVHLERCSGRWTLLIEAFGNPATSMMVLDLDSGTGALGGSLCLLLLKPG
jgi:hypothetical protein